MLAVRRRFITALAGSASLAVPAWVRAQMGIKIGLSLPLSGAPSVRNAIQSGSADVGLDFLAGFQRAVAAERDRAAGDTGELEAHCDARFGVGAPALVGMSS